jgi:RNA polymerase sigma factor (sigma-70 family)
MVREDPRSDAELAAAVAVEPEAFGEIYRRHEQALLLYMRHWCGSPELAADLTAETFAAALGSVSGYRSERGPLRGWLFGIARHVLAASLEKGRVEDAARQQLGMVPLVVDDDALERIEALTSLDGSATALLGELTEPIRAAVLGRVVEEREYAELARALECSPSLVRQRVRRGLLRLRELLEVKQ